MMGRLDVIPPNIQQFSCILNFYGMAVNKDEKMILLIQLLFVFVPLSVVLLTVIGIIVVLGFIVSATYLFRRKRKRDSRELSTGLCSCQ